MAKFMAMVDMARTPEEIEDEIEQRSDGPMARAPIYPYGLCIRLDEETLQKMNLDWDGAGDMPATGEMIHIAAMAKVTSVTDREDELADGTKKRFRCVELQITHLALEDEDAESEPKGAKWYGDKKDAA